MKPSLCSRLGTQSDNVTKVGKGTFYIFGKLQRTTC